MAGLSASGLVIKSLTDILTEVKARELADISADLDLSDEVFLGQLNTIISDQLDQAWQGISQVYASAYRDTATGAQLDLIGALTGTPRLAPAASTVNVVALGVNATLLSAGRIVSVAGTPTSKFTSASPATITTVAARAISTGYAVGDLRTNDTGKIYYCTVAGISSAGGGPTGTGSNIVDGSCQWTYVAPNTYTAAVVIPMAATVTGPVVAGAYSLTTIETPVSGWNAVTNPVAGALGRDLETDAAYRVRQVSSLRVTGLATPEAIASQLLTVAGVTAALVFENVTDVTNGDGLPPHSFEAVVLGGSNADIGLEVWQSKAAGIQTYGSITQGITDAAGNPQSVKFSRPTDVPFYLVITLTAKTALWPSDGVTQVKNALVDYWATKQIGESVIRSLLYAPIDDNVSGITDVTNIQLGFTPAPVGTSNLTITSRQLASLIAANITVNVTLV